MKIALPKDLIPLVALAVGIVCFRWLSALAWLIPYTISGMLFLTFLRVMPSDLRLRRAHFVLLLIQIVLTLGAYCFAPHGVLRECIVLLLLTPTATAAPAIVQLLSGDTGFTTSYTLLSHTMVILIAPMLLQSLSPGINIQINFVEQAGQIFMSIAPLIVPPILSAWTLARVLPRSAELLRSNRQMPFFIWLTSLILLMAHTTKIMTEQADMWSWIDVGRYIAISFGVCSVLFGIGSYLPFVLNQERHALRQSMGQKNTTLALWLATLFLSPLTSIAVASYIIWQNLIITYLMTHSRRASA